MLQFFRKRTANAKDDVLSGLTVALALVPEAIAFAFVAGVSPLIGLYSAFFIGLITAVLGGRPGMICGATGAMAVVVVALVAEHGVEYLFFAVILCGLIQMAVGFGRLGMLVRIVPHSVMLGFVNGLAIVILLAQFGSFKILGDDGALHYMQGPALWLMLGLVALTMAIIWLLPKITRAVPASLAAIVTVTIIAVSINTYGPASWATNEGSNIAPTVRDMLATNLQAKAVRDTAGAIQQEKQNEFAGTLATAGLAVVPASSHHQPELAPAQVEAAMASVDPETVGISGSLPRLMWFNADYVFPPLNMATLWIILPYAVVLAGVGLIESLMTLTLIDEITETRGRGNRECVGQGVANVVCGMFGGMGGCAMIGQSLINVNSGGRGRLSGITAAVCLLLFVLFFASWIEMIPMAALVGVMFMVVIGTFEWATLKIWGKVPMADIFVMLLVTIYTVVMHDLATAVVLGVAVSAMVFAWRHATHIGADIKFNEQGSKIYQLHGPLFFASVRSFTEMFDPRNDPKDVVIDFYYTRVYDQSGMEAINNLADRYRTEGKMLHLTHLSPECRKLLDKASDLVVVNMSEDPQYHVATERLG